MSAQLAKILGDLAQAPDAAQTIAGLAADSRAVVPGGVFLACAGQRGHGLDWLDDALAHGASVVLWEPAGDRNAPAVPAGVTLIEVPDLRAHSGSIADRFYGAPSRDLQVIGVTGTNGKTSVTHIVAAALAAAGKSCGVIGTLGYGFPGALQAASHTTPDAVTTHGLLAGLRDDGAHAVAMEVSSHALDQDRVGGVQFGIAVFTNLTRDHLDYHGDLAAYGATKRRLFTRTGLAAAVICDDDPFGRVLVDSVDPGVRVTRVGVASVGHCVRVDSVTADTHGMQLVLSTHAGPVSFRSPLLGTFNAMNLALAAGVLLECELDADVVAGALAAVTTVPGRMEAFGGTGGQPLVIVDYAHTPDALEQALRAARAHTDGNLFCVFGCGGDRDRGKRPIMAAVAASWADALVVTDDNPRGEDGDAIVADIVAGFPAAARWSVQRDRASAIRDAVAQAGPGDTVLVAGKGHEDKQLVGDRVLPFSDRDTVAAVVGAAR
jgi:UDP-N-acetylmuramoyl-L-alanyl-D-glutamate--2,6-diaminopimelate ligase